MSALHTAAREALEACPFCGGAAEFERMGTPRQSCIVVCGNCGARHESNDEGANCGQSWNTRAALDAGQAQPVAEFHAHPADWQYSITLLPGVPMLKDGTKLYAAPQASQPVAPAGWKLVPVEPTDEMRDAGLEGTMFGGATWTSMALSAYRAMLSAAPPAPAAQPLTEERIDSLAGVLSVDSEYMTVDGHRNFARAAIAEFCRLNGIRSET